MHVSQEPGDPGSVVLRFSGRLERSYIAHICERSRVELARDPCVVICDVRRVIEPDAVTIDALARLVLAARSFGHQVEIRDSSDRLEGLLRFIGLRDVMPLVVD